jgi:hypothetical protein
MERGTAFIAWHGYIFTVHGPKMTSTTSNGIRDDNRLVNLRDVTHKENLRNQKLSSSNKSGMTGVSWNKALNKWRALITVDYKMKHLGVFINIEDATQARKKAEKKYGYHANHGRS